MIELAVLGLLQEQPLHGYELRKRLGETLGSWSGVSFGSLYPALKRLERAGAIEVADPAPGPSGAPSTGSLTGDLAAARRARRHRPGRRTRKAYRITDAGQRLFTELLTARDAGSDEERSFALRLAFCRFLPPERRIDLLEARRSTLLERLDRTRRHIEDGSVTDRYTRALVEHRERTARADLEWIDGLLADERAADPEPRPETEGARS